MAPHSSWYTSQFLGRWNGNGLRLSASHECTGFGRVWAKVARNGKVWFETLSHFENQLERRHFHLSLPTLSFPPPFLYQATSLIQLLFLPPIRTGKGYTNRVQHASANYFSKCHQDKRNSSDMNSITDKDATHTSTMSARTYHRQCDAVELEFGDTTRLFNHSGGRVGWI